MVYLISSNQSKPNRIETQEADKNVDYHIRYARWAIGSGSTQMHRDYISNYQVNRKFYMNRQWVMQEDLEAFFKDETGQDRNRLKVTRNYVQPMVETYRGNAERMTFNMKVINLSPLARSRRDMALHRLLMYNDITKVMPGFKQSLRNNNIPVGSEPELIEKFNTLYNDQHVIAANRLVRYSRDINKFDDYRGTLARDVALAGICIMKPYPYSGEWMFKRVTPDRFGWDRSALDQCLLDAEYFWEDDLTSGSTIFEKYQSLGLEERKAIENYASNYTKQNPNLPVDISVSGKIPTFHAVWRDMVVDTFGYVTDQYGQRVLARIDYIEDNETEPRYTEKDLVAYSDLTEYQKNVLKRNPKGMVNLYVDLWRYCDFIPVEVVPVRRDGKASDIVLEYGIVPYQEPDPYKPTNMAPPYKVGTWSYLDGELISPVDVVINPQRMINRFLSVMENQINNSGGAGVVYDKDLTGMQSEDVINTKISRGESIGVNAKGKGVQNIFGRYDSTPKEAIVAFSNLIESFKLGIEQVTGVNEAVKGESNNPDQLVGVMQLMIQRGSIIQEPFYKAIMDCFKGCYQSIITSGKRYYIDNDIELMDAVGEDSASILKLSKDMRNEAMRITLTRSMDDANERLTVDSTLVTWLQFGLIDQDVVSKLYGRATMEEALFEMREYQKRLAVQKRAAMQQEQAMAMQQQNVKEQAGQVLYNESVRDKTREDLNKQADRDLKLQLANNA